MMGKVTKMDRQVQAIEKKLDFLIEFYRQSMSKGSIHGSQLNILNAGADDSCETPGSTPPNETQNYDPNGRSPTRRFDHLQVPMRQESPGLSWCIGEGSVEETTMSLSNSASLVTQTERDITIVISPSSSDGCMMTDARDLPSSARAATCLTLARTIDVSETDSGMTESVPPLLAVEEIDESCVAETEVCENSPSLGESLSPSVGQDDVNMREDPQA
uniref:Potassium channel voltage dependent KCNQ C-terminal domain-containing protein n=1 Tax=Eptatretus burgeri TaxID=7764 RepID=A0A8C4R4B8_EPTBU